MIQHTEEEKRKREDWVNGKEIDKNEGTLSLLKFHAANGDAKAMRTLAECFALGREMKQDAERAERLVTESAKNGNDEAQRLLKLINEHKRKGRIAVFSMCQRI